MSRLLAVVLTLAAPAWCPAAERKPNILWLVGENIDLDLGCYGEKLVRTPNLDRLAAEGVRYTRVYATAPVCSASRSAFMTGMYQTTTGTHNARSHRDDGFRLPAGVRPLTHRLHDAGYLTANVKTVDGKTVGTGKVDLNFTWDGKLFDTESWADLKGRQPFYAQVNSPEVEYDIYDRKSAGKERVEWVGERDHPKIATPENVTPPPYYPDHPVTRGEWARYLNSVSGMDRRIGVVLDRLRADGLLEDTVVIFFADNGRLEARGIHWCYDSGLHVPMIVRWPKNFPAPPQYRPGSASDQVISLLDLTATTLAVAGVARPEGMQSRVFLGATADPARTHAFAARDRIDETVQRIRSVRDGRFHYIRNFMPDRPFTALNRYKEKCFPVMPLMRQLHAEGKLDAVQAALMAPRLPDEELYDTGGDPHEIKNLAKSPDAAHRAALARLRGELENWVKETKDRGAELEPADLVTPFDREMHEWFGTPEWARGGEPGARSVRARDVFDPKKRVMFRDDFRAEAEPLKQWNYSEDDRYRLKAVTPERIKVVDAPGLGAGHKAVRFVVERAPNSFRSELSLPHESGFRERWYAARILIPDEWVFDPAKARDIVMQWHAIPGDWRATFPNLAIAVSNDRWQVDQSFGDPKTKPGRASAKLDDPVRRGEWVSWVVRANWSPGDDGRLQVWKDGKLVIDRKGPNAYGTIGVEYTPYLKTGIYHPAWRIRDDDQRAAFDKEKPVATRKVVYVTDVKIGNEQAGYEDLAPAQMK